MEKKISIRISPFGNVLECDGYKDEKNKNLLG
jgi:hypothetical protein